MWLRGIRGPRRRRKKYSSCEKFKEGGRTKTGRSCWTLQHDQTDKLGKLNCYYYGAGKFS
jgi:hypothetical protein